MCRIEFQNTIRPLLVVCSILERNTLHFHKVMWLLLVLIVIEIWNRIAVWAAKRRAIITLFTGKDSDCNYSKCLSTLFPKNTPSTDVIANRYCSSVRYSKCKDSLRDAIIGAIKRVDLKGTFHKTDIYDTCEKIISNYIRVGEGIFVNEDCGRLDGNSILYVASKKHWFTVYIMHFDNAQHALDVWRAAGLSESGIAG